MLEELKTDCFIRVDLIAMNVQLEYFEIDIRNSISLSRYKYLYRYIVAALPQITINCDIKAICIIDTPTYVYILL